MAQEIWENCWNVLEAFLVTEWLQCAFENQSRAECWNDGVSGVLLEAVKSTTFEQ